MTYDELMRALDLLIDTGEVPEDVVRFAGAINGYNEEMLNDILWYYTGYRSWEQYRADQEEG